MYAETKWALPGSSIKETAKDMASFAVKVEWWFYV